MTQMLRTAWRDGGYREDVIEVSRPAWLRPAGRPGQMADYPFTRYSYDHFAAKDGRADDYLR
jgi:hypothetical protein